MAKPMSLDERPLDERIAQAGVTVDQGAGIDAGVAEPADHLLLTELGTLELLPADRRHRENFSMRCYQTLPIRLCA